MNHIVYHSIEVLRSFYKMNLTDITIQLLLSEYSRHNWVIKTTLNLHQSIDLRQDDFHQSMPR